MHRPYAGTAEESDERNGEEIMTVFEIRDALGLTPLHEAEDRPVTGGYAGDLLSWVMGRAESGDCWITIMSNRNVPAVCTLTDVAMVIFAEDVTPDDAALEAAVKNDLNFYGSPLSVFDLCAKVAALLS
jgi:hypothetical protein